jgi:hypothetical protein
MTRVITALRSTMNKTVSGRCDPKPGSLVGLSANLVLVKRYIKDTSGLQSIQSIRVD